MNALQNPDRWSNGADALVVENVLHDGWRSARIQRVENAWRRAFPGAPFLEESL